MADPKKTFQSPFHRPNAELMAAATGTGEKKFQKFMKGVIAGQCVQKNNNSALFWSV